MNSLRTRLAALPCLALLCLFAAAAEVRADPVAITSGFWTVSGLAVNVNAVMSGDGISISAHGQGSGPLTGPYNPGSLLSINSSTSALDSITVNGYSNSNLLYSIGDTFQFVGGSIVVPDTLDPTVTLPFTFAGHVSVFTTTSPLMQFVNSDLVGQGIATLTFTSFTGANGQRVQELRSVTYTFAPAATVPEPGAMLLLGSGLAGAFADVRRRRRAKS